MDGHGVLHGRDGVLGFVRPLLRGQMATVVDDEWCRAWSCAARIV